MYLRLQQGVSAASERLEVILTSILMNRSEKLVEDWWSHASRPLIRLHQVHLDDVVFYRPVSVASVISILALMPTATRRSLLCLPLLCTRKALSSFRFKNPYRGSIRKPSHLSQEWDFSLSSAQSVGGAGERSSEKRGSPKWFDWLPTCHSLTSRCSPV